jgi:simple sugar transport system permease protein
MLAPLAVLLGVVGVLALLLLAGGYPLGPAFAALVRGTVGSSYAFWSATLVRSTPLVLLGLAVALAFRAGILNIGAEGQLLAGASAAVAVGLAGGAWPVAVLAGAGAGAAWAGIAAWLKQRFGVLEVISTLMLNFIALYLVSYLVRGPMQEPTHVYPQSSSLAAAARLPLLLPGQQVHVGALFALALPIMAWWYLQRTAGGFRLRAVGANAAAAASAGRVRVTQVLSWTFVCSGAIAGLAGASEATGVTYALYENLSPGFGYTAIAVALLARSEPLAVIGAGLFFGALEAGGVAMQRDAGVPSAFVAIVEATVILGVLLAERVREASVHVVAEEDA